MDPIGKRSAVTRAIGVVLLLLGLCFGLPVLAEAARHLVEPLLGVLVFLIIVRLALPPDRHR